MLAAVTPRQKPSLTNPQFQQLQDVPAEAQWFANIDNPQTRRAYESDIRSFMRSAGIIEPKDFRRVTGSPCFWCDLGRFRSPYPCGLPEAGLLKPAWLLDSLTPSLRNAA